MVDESQEKSILWDAHSSPALFLPGEQSEQRKKKGSETDPVYQTLSASVP